MTKMTWKEEKDFLYLNTERSSVTVKLNCDSVSTRRSGEFTLITRNCSVEIADYDLVLQWRDWQAKRFVEKKNVIPPVKKRSMMFIYANHPVTSQQFVSAIVLRVSSGKKNGGVREAYGITVVSMSDIPNYSFQKGVKLALNWAYKAYKAGSDIGAYSRYTEKSAPTSDLVGTFVPSESLKLAGKTGLMNLSKGIFGKQVYIESLWKEARELGNVRVLDVHHDTLESTKQRQKMNNLMSSVDEYQDEMKEMIDGLTEYTIHIPKYEREKMENAEMMEIV